MKPEPAQCSLGNAIRYDGGLLETKDLPKNLLGEDRKSGPLSQILNFYILL